MKIDDELLKKAYDEYLNTRIPSSRQNCPDFDALTRLSDQYKLGCFKEDIIEHIFRCRPCADEFMFIKEVRRQQSILIDGIQQITEAAPPKSTLKMRTFNFYGMWKPATIGIGILFVFLFIWYRGFRSTTVSFRSAIAEEEHGVPIRLFKPLRSQNAPFRLILRWTDTRPNSFYKLEIFDEALFPTLSVTNLRKHEFIIPEALARRMIQGGSWFWAITSYSSNGKEFSSSLHRIRLDD